MLPPECTARVTTGTSEVDLEEKMLKPPETVVLTIIFNL
jgi:hypothetical protein